MKQKDALLRASGFGLLGGHSLVEKPIAVIPQVSDLLAIQGCHQAEAS